MLIKTDYLGPFLTDTTLPGETKADGIIPAHANGAIQLSHDIWFIACATLDPNGWDAVHSVIYQLRRGGPMGAVFREGILAACESGWHPPVSPVPLRKIYGMPMAFGVPKGATLHGQPMPNANHFVVKMYRHGLPEIDGRIMTCDEIAKVWADTHVKPDILRIEWLQFRLNSTEDDIEILQPLQTMSQQGCDPAGTFCSIPAQFMNHAMTPPIPETPEALTWCEVDTFGGASGSRTHGQIAPVAYTWNAETRRYQWTRTGQLTGVPDITLGETSISRWDDAWVIAARTWNRGGVTAWFRTTDLFTTLGEPTWHQTTWGPRHSYRCADDTLRIFHNDQSLSPHGDKRNPLYMFEVDPVTFVYSSPRVLLDARQHLPFDPPFLDMAKLCPPVGNTQLLIFRAIDQTMTTDQACNNPADWQRRLESAGVHAIQLTYDHVEPSLWDLP